MSKLSQFLLCCVIVVAGLAVWITSVPAARPLLERAGLVDLLGLAPVEAAAGPSRRGGRGAPTVVVAEVEARALATRISALGEGRARRSVTVRSNAVGVITNLPVAAGSYVEAGDIIVELEDENERIALAGAQIALEDATADIDLVRQLQASGSAPETRLREASLARRRAELMVRQAEYDLSQRRVLAPISGWVGIIDLEQGDRVGAQDVLVEITDRSEIMIDFRVPERVISQISTGQTFDVTPVGFGETLTGEISAIDAVVDRSSRTLLVRGRIPNDADRLRAGMAFSVELTFPGETVLAVAPLAIQWSGDGSFVWRVRDGVAQMAPVVIAQRDADVVLVTSDALVAGDRIVTEGVQTLRPGAEVEIATPPGDEPAPPAGRGDDA